MGKKNKGGGGFMNPLMFARRRSPPKTGGIREYLDRPRPTLADVKTVLAEKEKKNNQMEVWEEHAGEFRKILDRDRKKKQKQRENMLKEKEEIMKKRQKLLDAGQGKITSEEAGLYAEQLREKDQDKSKSKSKSKHRHKHKDKDRDRHKHKHKHKHKHRSKRKRSEEDDEAEKEAKKPKGTILLSKDISKT